MSKYYEVHVKLGANDWIDGPIRAASDRDAVKVVMDMRDWTRGHVSTTNKDTSDFADVRALKRDVQTGNWIVLGLPRRFRLRYQ